MQLQLTSREIRKSEFSYWYHLTSHSIHKLFSLNVVRYFTFDYFGWIGTGENCTIGIVNSTSYIQHKVFAMRIIPREMNDGDEAGRSVWAALQPSKLQVATQPSSLSQGLLSSSPAPPCSKKILPHWLPQSSMLHVRTRICSPLAEIKTEIWSKRHKSAQLIKSKYTNKEKLLCNCKFNPYAADG